MVRKKVSIRGFLLFLSEKFILSIEHKSAEERSVNKYCMNDITPISLQSDLDLDKNLSHYDLLDTDQNRLKIRKLFHTSFPQSNLLTFICSENDQNKYVLEFSVYISYEDLENLWGKLYPKEGMR